MEDMAREFGGMLKATLDKMRERIELEFDAAARRSAQIGRRRACQPCRAPLAKLSAPLTWARRRPA